MSLAKAGELIAAGWEPGARLAQRPSGLTDRGWAVLARLHHKAARAYWERPWNAQAHQEFLMREAQVRAAEAGMSLREVCNVARRFK